MSYLETRYNYVKNSGDAFYDFKARTLLDVVAAFRREPVRSFVDLGAGCGDLVRAMKRVAGLESAGVDLDEAMVKQAEKIDGGEYVHGSITKITPALNNRFDVIASLEVFEHLTHDEHAQAFKTYQAYATPGGTGVILVPNAAHPFLSGWISWSDYTHRTCFTPESLAQFLRSQGVSDAKILPWYLAGSKKLLMIRRLAGTICGALFKLKLGLFSTIPKSLDPFITDAIPMSSHIVAVFTIPK